MSAPLFPSFDALLSAESQGGNTPSRQSYPASTPASSSSGQYSLGFQEALERSGTESLVEDSPPYPGPPSLTNNSSTTSETSPTSSSNSSTPSTPTSTPNFLSLISPPKRTPTGSFNIALYPSHAASLEQASNRISTSTRASPSPAESLLTNSNPPTSSTTSQAASTTPFVAPLTPTTPLQVGALAADGSAPRIPINPMGLTLPSFTPKPWTASSTATLTTSTSTSAPRSPSVASNISHPSYNSSIATQSPIQSDMAPPPPATFVLHDLRARPTPSTTSSPQATPPTSGTHTPNLISSQTAPPSLPATPVRLVPSTPSPLQSTPPASLVQYNTSAFVTTNQPLAPAPYSQPQLDQLPIPQSTPSASTISSATVPQTAPQISSFNNSSHSIAAEPHSVLQAAPSASSPVSASSASSAANYSADPLTVETYELILEMTKTLRETVTRVSQLEAEVQSLRAQLNFSSQNQTSLSAPSYFPTPVESPPAYTQTVRREISPLQSGTRR